MMFKSSRTTSRAALLAGAAPNPSRPPGQPQCFNPASLDRRPGDHQADGQEPYHQAR